MKRSALKPYILQAINATIIYLAIPIFLLSTSIIRVTVDNEHGNFGVLFVIAAIFGYFYVIAEFFVPGIYALFDMLADNFVTCRMTYVSSYVDRSKPLVYNNAIARVSRMEAPNERCFLRILLANHKGKSTFLTTHYHLMEKGKSYTIVYGKFSKVITSVLSDEGQELLQLDVA